jgi:hypothetical protein
LLWGVGKDQFSHLLNRIKMVLVAVTKTWQVDDMDAIALAELFHCLMPNCAVHPPTVE